MTYEEANFLFGLIRHCRTHVRQSGIKGNDYSLCHEARSLALRYEDGEFDKALEICKKLAKELSEGPQP